MNINAKKKGAIDYQTLFENKENKAVVRHLSFLEWWRNKHTQGILGRLNTNFRFMNMWKNYETNINYQ